MRLTTFQNEDALRSGGVSGGVQDHCSRHIDLNGRYGAAVAGDTMTGAWYQRPPSRRQCGRLKAQFRMRVASAEPIVAMVPGLCRATPMTE